MGQIGHHPAFAGGVLGRSTLGVEALRDTIQPEDVLTQREYKTLERARAGRITCPWCEDREGIDRPLSGSFYFFVAEGRQHKGVYLRCAACGFDER